MAIYERRLAASPSELRVHRFLVSACVRARAFQRALAVVEAGLELARDDAPLFALRGEAKAGLDDPDGALADWRRALELEPEDIGALYSIAFLLEHEGRLAEAIKAWRSIVDWNESEASRCKPHGRGSSSSGCVPAHCDAPCHIPEPGRAGETWT